mmetsp:Transcript_22290/g.28558  ORF Transcript_22290/g.28558 Transcript_22290/m.28558 type:complete len:203 (-) Transcript_22290:223-831(-)
MENNSKHKPAPEAGDLQLSASSRVSKWLEQCHWQLLLAPEGVFRFGLFIHGSQEAFRVRQISRLFLLFKQRSLDTDVVYLVSFTVDFFELVTSTDEESDGKEEKEKSHECRKPSGVIQLVIGEIDDGTESEANSDSNNTRKRNGLGTRSLEEEWNEENTNFGNLTPHIPCNIETNRLERKTNGDTIFALLTRIYPQELWNLE